MTPLNNLIEQMTKTPYTDKLSELARRLREEQEEEQRQEELIQYKQEQYWEARSKDEEDYE